MKLVGYASIRQTAALGIAGIVDLIDFALIGATPGLGEPLDIGVSIINSILLKDPKPMIGLIEATSIVPPLAVLDFVPLHSVLAWYTIKGQKKKR